MDPFVGQSMESGSKILRLRLELTPFTPAINSTSMRSLGRMELNCGEPKSVMLDSPLRR
jgi:hypothetical protein